MSCNELYFVRYCALKRGLENSRQKARLRVIFNWLKITKPCFDVSFLTSICSYLCQKLFWDREFFNLINAINILFIVLVIFETKQWFLTLNLIWGPICVWFSPARLLIETAQVISRVIFLKKKPGSWRNTFFLPVSRTFSEPWQHWLDLIFHPVRYTWDICRHLYQCVEEHKHSVIERHFRKKHRLTSDNFINYELTPKSKKEFVWKTGRFDLWNK